MKKKYNGLPVSPGQEVEAEVTDLAYGGDGVAKYKNFTIFIPYSIPGDRILAKVAAVKKNYARAVIKKTIKASPNFTIPKCPHFKKCGGCHWMNIKYEKQIEYKKKIFSQMAGCAFPGKAPDIIPSPEPFRYRNRAQYKLSSGPDKISMGFYRAKSHEVEDVGDCLLLREKINEIARHTSNFLNGHKKEVTIYNENTGDGYLRGVAVRVNRDDDALVTFITAKNSVKKFIYKYADYIKNKTGKIAGVTVNINTKETNRVFGEKETVVDGAGIIRENAAGVNFKIGASAFFQVNTLMLEKMAGFVKKHAGKNARVLDIYGGTGALSLPLAKTAKEVFIIEADEKNTVLAEGIITENNIENAGVRKGKAEKETGRMPGMKKIDVVILDPPRKGADPAILDAIKKHRVKKIIYVSCNPATFARDAKRLSDVYEIKEIIPMDLFPHTYHIEIMSCMKLSEKQA